jgi:4-alpha-glucanotransferase
VTRVARRDDPLSELARLRGVQLGYTGHDGRRVVASRETLQQVLAALGYPASDEASITEQLDRARGERHSHGLGPVYVMRPGGAVSSSISLAAAVDLDRAWLSVELEDGRVERRALAQIAARQPAAGTQRALLLNLAALDIPMGYHRLVLEIESRRTTALLLAPPKPPPPPVGGLGVISPVYALRSENDWGIGSYTDLAAFADWVGHAGGSLAGTLPLFASFTRPPMDPSPYLPISRRFWNDLYIDVESLPEYAGPAVGSAPRPNSTVDYDDVVARKRAALDACAESLCSQPSTRRP